MRVTSALRRLPRRRGPRAISLVLALFLPWVSCTNDPYPEKDAHEKILYSSFLLAPRTLDPAVAYTTTAHVITGAVYASLLQYHYLLRPYTLIPDLGLAVPVRQSGPDGRPFYRFDLRRDLLYHDDPCFELSGRGRRTREVVATDVAFSLMRIADPAVNSPVVEPFSSLAGFDAFRERLQRRREADSDFAALPVHAQYEAVGAMEGVRVRGRYGLEIVLEKTNPQILYWFAMPFSAPLPWEAVQYYDGSEGRPRLADHPVGAGAYRLVEYEKQSRFVLQAAPNWHGLRHPEWKAPGTLYPARGEARDRVAGRLDASLAGRPLPFIKRIEFRREKESIPYFNKFLQGYYDSSGVIKESFDKVIHEGGLSPEMAAIGISLEKSVQPAVFYIGFNMEDERLGAPAGERGRKLRQAMSMAIDSQEFARLFMNGRGVSAQSPLPPGIFGYDENYRNPYRQVDLERARRWMREAGYADGVDPSTDRPLALTFDTSDTSAQGRLRFQFFTQAWRQLGIDVKVAATNYNQFQEKVRRGAYQVFMWGWVADYPDPENFLFLLWSEMARSKNNGPNTANFSNARYDELFLSMKGRENGPKRQAEIDEMLGILERERPWIELYHPENYSLYHSWLHNVKPFGMSYPMTKYIDLDPVLRGRLRSEWNRPILWPLYVLLLGFVLVLVPGIVTYLRERQ